ncbi:MAG: ribonuclease P protein subunit [Candidatus Thermoplasmatota archaeon]|jgi:ribonuclease P protein subunit POP4|nr:ribonuclease P protein subunit [Candidatus Thermoplasmatota archaeon]
MNEKELARQELIGLKIKIKDCKDPHWIGKSGLIIDETKNTFLIKIDNQQKTIAKNIAIFELDYEGKKVILDGSKISYRPEDRIKKIR